MPAAEKVSYFFFLLSKCERPLLGEPSPTPARYDLIALLEGILLSGALLQVTLCESGGGATSLIRCEWHNGGAQLKPACVFPPFKVMLLRPSITCSRLTPVKASLSFPPQYVAPWLCESWKGPVTRHSRRVEPNARFLLKHEDVHYVVSEVTLTPESLPHHYVFPEKHIFFPRFPPNRWQIKVTLYLAQPR